jgi:hypothetical protein
VERRASVQSFVHRGGGLMLIGDATKPSPLPDPFQHVLPPPGVTPAGPVCVVLVLERSAAMDGPKMELAKMASYSLVENLRSMDKLGVLTYDDTFNWTVPIRNDRQRDSTDQQIEEITVGGGSHIASALAEAIERIALVGATSKHIVLLTDGISEDPEAIAFATRAASRRVTVSTVAVGEHANGEYLDRVAKSGHGDSLFIRDPLDVDSVFLSDVITYTSTPDIGRRFEVPRPDPGAETGRALGVNPTALRRQYGKGRAVFIIRGFESQGKLWQDAFEFLLAHQSRQQITYDRVRDELVLDYSTASDLEAIGPGGIRLFVKLERTADHVFRARVPCGHATGPFRIRAQNHAAGVAEMALYRQDTEQEETGGVRQLREISELTGGRFNPRTGKTFTPRP